jgi:hypothetical protein
VGAVLSLQAGHSFAMKSMNVAGDLVQVVLDREVSRVKPVHFGFR